VGVRYVPERGVRGVCGRGGTTAGTCARAGNRDSRDSREVGARAREQGERGKHGGRTRGCCPQASCARNGSGSNSYPLPHLTYSHRPCLHSPPCNTRHMPSPSPDTYCPVHHIHTSLAHTYDLPACTYPHPPSLVLSYT
jgi:hypothetical protein